MALLLFEPIYQERIWGGQNLKELFGRDIPEDKPIGESWEISDRPEADCKLIGESKTLHDFWSGPDKQKIFGTKAPDTERFPILIKILDAQEKLSLQVHPPAEVAPKFKGEPKTELWYFLQTQQDSLIYVGLKKGVTRKDFEQAVEDKTVAGCFHQLKTEPGEVMFLPSGRVHAIGGGNVILEIQQNSDTTFRVYDWDRVDAKTGKGRELHVEQSLECIDFGDYEPLFSQPHGERVIACDLFNINRCRFFEKEEREVAVGPESFLYLFVADGTFKIGNRECKPGESLFVTADTGEIEIAALEDSGELVSVSFP